VTMDDNTPTEDSGEGSQDEPIVDTESGENEPEEGVEEESTDESDKPKLSHDDALKALKKVRNEAADWRTRYRDLEGKLAEAKTADQVDEIVNAMKVERESAERELLVENIALKHRLPDELATALKGNTREELEAHAKVLAKFVPSEDIDPDRGAGGLDPNDEDGSFDPVKLARAARTRRY